MRHSRLAKRVKQVKSSHGHPHVSSAYHAVLYVLGCTRATLMYSTRVGTQMVEVIVALDMARSGEVLFFAYNNCDVDYVP